MMNNRRFMLASAMTLLMTCSAIAQDQDHRGVLNSYSYVEAQGGVQLTSTDAPMDKLITPTAALSFGHYFSPVVGARLHVNAWEAKSGFSDIKKYYKWKYVTPDLDLMLNLTNLFAKSDKEHLLNVILLGGVGLNYAWDNDDLEKIDVATWRKPLAWDDNRLSHNLRAGLRLETNPAKKLGLSLEVNANSIDDRFNSKTNDADDWQFRSEERRGFRFGHKYKKTVVESAPVVEEVVEEEVVEVAPAPVVVEKKKVKKEIVHEEPITLHKVLYYDLCKTDPNASEVKEIADFIKNNKDARVKILGYADKETGNARVNRNYAKGRAEGIQKMLVKEFGVDSSVISTDSKGDTVQPFPEDNSKNRCAIIDGTATRVYTETIEVEE